MKELNEIELREVDGGCPWLGFGLMNAWLIMNVAEFCQGVADGYNESKC